ncbi:hypothetical protein ACJMK2_041040 [Sinanodonta woodiana]|uniref:Uncharacterized protein n=1 Tax=Sinanodonta woodiana TaxID=1069815 RepID=A0ABD3W5Q1_SINWO
MMKIYFLFTALFGVIPVIVSAQDIGRNRLGNELKMDAKDDIAVQTSSHNWKNEDKDQLLIRSTQKFDTKIHSMSVIGSVKETDNSDNDKPVQDSDKISAKTRKGKKKDKGKSARSLSPSDKKKNGGKLPRGPAKKKVDKKPRPEESAVPMESVVDENNGIDGHLVMLQNRVSELERIQTLNSMRLEQLEDILSDSSTREMDKIKEQLKRLDKQAIDIKETVSKLSPEGVPIVRKHEGLEGFMVKSFNEITDIEKLETSSGEECWMKCTDTNACLSASFLAANGTCKLSRVSAFDIGAIEQASGWVVFAKHFSVSYASTDPKYGLDFSHANATCESMGASVATLEDLQSAFKEGYQRCGCGWTANGNAYLVSQQPMNACLSSVGIISCTWQSTWDVFCKIIKPQASPSAVDYAVIEGRRMNSDPLVSLDTTVATEASICAERCTNTPFCVSASFNSLEKKCELSTLSAYDRSTSTNDDNWVVYTKADMPVFLLKDPRGSDNATMTLGDARRSCRILGTRLARFEELYEAYQMGYMQCSCGWADSGIVYAIMQKPVHGCTNSIGVIKCNGQTTGNAYCRALS